MEALRLVTCAFLAMGLVSDCVLAVEIKARSRNPLSVEQIKTDYQKFKKQYPTDPIDIEHFSAQMDQLDGDDRRFELYKTRPDIYPTMPLAWVEAAYRDFKKMTKGSDLSFTDFAWQMDSYEGGRRYFEGYKNSYGGTVVLYDFLGMEKFPIGDVLVLDKKPGYIRLLQRNGKHLEHSGRYSIIE